MEFLTILFYLLLKRGVLWLFLVGAIVFGIVRWRRHPRISAMAVAALTIYLIASLTFGILYRLLPSLLIPLNVNADSIIILEDVLMVCDDLIYAGALILLVAAAFSRRQSVAA